MASFGPWAGIAEQLALVAGGPLAYASVAHSDAVRAARLIQCGRLLFGVRLLSFGFAHFLYVAETAALVPAWLPPSQTFWAYAGGRTAAERALTLTRLSSDRSKPNSEFHRLLCNRTRRAPQPPSRLRSRQLCVREGPQILHILFRPRQGYPLLSLCHEYRPSKKHAS